MEFAGRLGPGEYEYKHLDFMSQPKFRDAAVLGGDATPDVLF